jgi:Flp pilus assembly protein TadG
MTAFKRAFSRFARSDDGVALVEFAIVLPMMLVVFAVIIEGSRLLLAYNSTIAGVRDATRYLSRVLPSNLCVTGGSISSHTSRLTTIVGQSMSGPSVLPSAVTLNSVTPSYACVTGTYRVNPAPVASVSASITVTYPFSGIFGLLGGSVPNVTTTVRDSAKVIGS